MNLDFDEHIKHDHSLWNYYFFLYSLKKDYNKERLSTDFSGIEYYVHDKVFIL